MLLLLGHFSRVQLCTTPLTAAHLAPLPMGIIQARVLKWTAMPSSRILRNPGIEPHLIHLCIGRRVLYH